MRRPVPAGAGRGREPEAGTAATRQEFLDFLDAEYAYVVRFVMRTGASLADAEDAAQHMAVQGWRKVLRGQWNREALPRPSAWARRVALNHHRAEHRDQGAISIGPDADRPAPGPGHAELTGQARDLVALLRVLDPECRMVIAFDLDDIPSADIARELGITQQQVRDRRAKARRLLKARLASVTDREGRPGRG
ncbi:sigma-70 family RNA polymerase sigma factor [Actinomadura roseirufa]|uniref:sigma-70 family RNA polymerase sigma factor n=1 Tax=Actinomadura roseirufa TaxID=2094049 RepID=UPI0013F162E9|nr:sigma-70 family RNA polymerase sigma factor [Actinomadura roseirufa]